MFFEDFKTETKYVLAPVRIEKDKMLAFAREYDPLPIHLDEDYAKKTQFGGLIAPGVMSFMSVWRQFLALGLLDEGLVAGKNTRVEWFAPVYAGDVLQGEARIVAVHERNAYNGEVHIAVSAQNQQGVMVLDSLTEAIVKRRGE